MAIEYTTNPCPFCGKTSQVRVENEEVKQLMRWIGGGVHVQEAFPQWDTAKRELLLTGFHGKCWDEVFAGADEEEAVERCKKCGSEIPDHSGEPLDFCTSDCRNEYSEMG